MNRDFIISKYDYFNYYIYKLNGETKEISIGKLIENIDRDCFYNFETNTITIENVIFDVMIDYYYDGIFIQLQLH